MIVSEEVGGRRGLVPTRHGISVPGIYRAGTGFGVLRVDQLAVAGAITGDVEVLRKDPLRASVVLVHDERPFL